MSNNFGLGMAGVSGDVDARSNAEKSEERAAYIAALMARYDRDYTIESNAELSALQDSILAKKWDAAKMYNANPTYEAYEELAAYERDLDAQLDEAVAAVLMAQEAQQ